MTKAIFVLLALASGVCRADILYSNTTNDTGFSVFYSTGYTEIGDQLQLTSNGQLDSLDAQFYNQGSDAMFDATVAFYNVGSPIGTQIGVASKVRGISIASSTSQTVTFSNLGGLFAPADLIVVFSVGNVSSGGDIGVNLFDAPTVGGSDDSFFIANDGSGLALASTLMDIDNVYLQINGSQISSAPEPSTLSVALTCLIVLATRRRRCV